MVDVAAGNGSGRPGAVSGQQQGDNKPNTIGAALASVLGFVLIAGPLAAFVIFHSQSGGPTSIGLGALEGLVVLSASLAGLIIVFQALGLAYSGAALGLPKGSVRALLAMSLVVIFVATASWTLGGLFDPTTTSTIVVPNNDIDVDAALARFSESNIPAFVVNRGKTNATIHYLQQRDSNAQAQITDLAKQVMTVVSTVLVTIVGFYFGSSSTVDGVRSAQKTMEGVKNALFSDSGGATTSGIYAAADMTRGAEATRAIATDLKTRLGRFGDDPTTILSEAAGSDAQQQERLKVAGEAHKAMKSASRSATVYADEAAALADTVTADTDQAMLDEIGPKMNELQDKAQESKKTFDAACKEFTAAHDAILGATASG